MSKHSEHEHAERIRDRFTRTAGAFSDFVLAERVAEADRLTEYVAPRGEECAVDLACGPGTLARRLAPRVRWVCGLDVTPAMLTRARRTAAEEGLKNFFFTCADATALPFPCGSVDILVCSFALHHIVHPEGVIGEAARVLRRGGRLGLMDLIVPEEAARAEANNRIENARDNSHTRTLSAGQIAAMCSAAGLRVSAQETRERRREFDHWMRVAGWKPGDAAYQEVRGLMEASMAGDSAGFHPRFRETGGGAKAEGILEFFQTTLLLAAVKE